MEELLKQAYDYQNKKEYDKAIELFKQLEQNAAYREIAVFETGKSYKMSNNSSKAIDCFIEVVAHNNEHIEAIKELSQTACLSNNYDKAWQLLDELFNKTNKIIFCIELIKMSFCKNDIMRAEDLIKKADAADSGNTEVQLLKAKLKRSQGYLTKAIEIFNGLADIEEYREDIYMELAEIYFLKGDYQKAIDFFEKIADKKNDKYIYLKLVELYYITKQNEKSDAAGQKALALTPDNKFDRDTILNEIEILQRKTVLQSKMKRLWVTVTSRCNIRCKTCGLWHNKWDLPYKTAKEVMNNYPYMERLVWLGGEVFLYKHFEEMFDEAGKWNNLKQQVITNGIALNKRWIEKIVKTENSELTFSIDGVTKEVYEEIRQGSNFEKLLENVRYTMETKKKYGIKKDIRMNAVIMKTNYRQIYDLLELAKNEGFNQLSLMALHFDTAPNENIFDGETKDREALKYIYEAIPVLKQRAKEYNIDLDILLPCGDDSFEDIISKQNEQNQEKPAVCGNEPVPEIRKEENEEPKDAIVPVNRVCCKMPWNYMMICDDGNVLLTGSCVKSIGNIYNNSIDEIWNSPMSREYRQRMIDKNFSEDMCRTECTGRW
ncbi:MAG: radical SAM protein [Endomicrobiaceae bacterium]|nr:radical SAM protein [Endomicrobiaceae bacterium]